MAPEILYGEPYGRRADIWALGCTLIEIASGKHPWFYDNIQDLEDLQTRMLRKDHPKMPE